jgi:hypothetical protein
MPERSVGSAIDRPAEPAAVRAAVLAVAVSAATAAGCYDPAVQIGLPCGDGCPTGQNCGDDGLCYPPGARPDATPADAPPPRPDAAPIDSDGDGIFDGDDNCADNPNTDQHDEDGDLRGDVCDFCPHVAELQVQDADGDRVGDLCDPLTGTQHRIAFFDPFTSDRPEWSFLGPWVRANDMLSIVADQDHAIIDLALGESVVELGGRITALGSMLNRQLTMTVSNDGAMLSYYCEIFDDGTPTVNLTENDNGSYSALDFEPLPNPIPTGPIRLASIQSVSDKLAACRVDYDVVHSLAGTAPVVATSEMHINIQHISLELDYAIQIEAVP